MGVVYLALAEGPGGFAKLKVVKRLRADLGDEPEAVQMFLQEGRISSHLHHPNVVQTNEVGYDGKHYFLEMEYLEGQSLAALTKRASRAQGLSIPIAVHVLAQTLAGLHYAHELKDHDGTDLAIVHRDVSPHNIFVTYDGDVKLLDFGIARAAGSSSETKTGFLKGKVTYMAPEQVARQSLDRRVDLFAIGVILWESLAGARLWGDLDDFQIFLKLRSEEIPSPRSVRPDIPDALEAICMRALARDPSQRYATAAEMQRALEAWLASSGEQAGAKELAATIDALFAADRAATKAEIEQQIRSAPASQESVEIPMLRAGASSATTAPGVGSEVGEATGVRERQQVRRLVVVGRVAIAVALVASVATGVATWRNRVRAKAAAAAAAAAAVPVEEPGMSKNPEAVAAYRAGVRAFLDADREGATQDFDRALAIDKYFPAAQLRRGIVTVLFEEEERGHLREAIAQRARLGAHDRVLLDAYAPRASVPEDAAETERRLARAFTAAPTDADFALQLCRAQNYLEADAARETCARASALDPDSAMPVRESALALVRLGDEPGARAAFEQCLRLSPLATYCASPLIHLDSYRGQCGDALANLRRVISANRAEADDYDSLASLLLATGEPVESAQLALDLEVQHAPKEQSAVTKVSGTTFMSTFTGDFGEAERQLRRWNELTAPSQDESDHFASMWPWIQLMEEQGKKSQAIAVLTDYLHRSATWTSAPDGIRVMIVAGELYRLGALSRMAFDERRTQWIAAKRATLSQGKLSPGAAWALIYAWPAMDAGDAREALRVLPGYLPLPDPLMRTPDLELPIGRVFRLAGRGRDAQSHLTTASESCLVLESPLEITLASYELGLVDEELADTSGACKAYGSVVRRWGAAGSTTASHARQRMRALRCD
jgi:tetratricopeptide (TPR) repeat protein